VADSAIIVGTDQTGRIRGNRRQEVDVKLRSNLRTGAFLPV
jgi:hypothetical protein